MKEIAMNEASEELKKERHRNLEIWKNALDLSNDIYELTRNFPKDEIFGLRSQMRRAGVSVPSNIAEGSKRSDKDFAHFLDIALGSLAELDTQFLIAERQGFLSYTDEIQRKMIGLGKGIRRFKAVLKTQ